MIWTMLEVVVVGIIVIGVCSGRRRLNCDFEIIVLMIQTGSCDRVFTIHRSQSPEGRRVSGHFFP
jgi:hypothetical protein